METQPDGGGESLALVVRLDTGADGQWRLVVDGVGDGRPVALRPAPAIFAVRLWRAAGTGALRGSVRLQAGEGWGEHEAPLHGNGQLEARARAWLLAAERGG